MYNVYTFRTYSNSLFKAFSVSKNDFLKPALATVTKKFFRDFMEYSGDLQIFRIAILTV